MSDTTQTSGNFGAGEDEYTPTGTDQVAEHLAALDDDEAELKIGMTRLAPLSPTSRWRALTKPSTTGSTHSRWLGFGER